MKETILAIDIGSSKIATIIANIQDKNVDILGFSISNSFGIEKGFIIDIEAGKPHPAMFFIVSVVPCPRHHRPPRSCAHCAWPGRARRRHRQSTAPYRQGYLAGVPRRLR